jgi:hypothetical protein
MNPDSEWLFIACEVARRMVPATQGRADGRCRPWAPPALVGPGTTGQRWPLAPQSRASHPVLGVEAGMDDAVHVLAQKWVVQTVV